MKKIMVSTKNTNIAINCGGRLHMGFFDLHGGLGRKFGSIGLSLAEPCLQLSASIAENIHVTGHSSVPLSTLSKATATAQALIEKLNLENYVNLHIEQHIPEHSGLGSGTQLALAVGSAISRLFQLNLSTEKIAALTGRGGRSGIGIAAFDQGGILIDGGRTTNFSSSTASQNTRTTHSKVPPLLARYDFPEEWRILLIFDSSQPGIHGNKELEAFNQLPEFSESLASYLCRHMLMQAMPALVEQDLAAFGNSIQALQSHVGDYFSPAQGGRYASKIVGTVLQYLDDLSAPCFGQSSWGPTGFAIFENSIEAESHLLQLKSKFTDNALTWKICSARNHGAELI